MKKLILIIALMVISINVSHSQCRIGYSMGDILTEFGVEEATSGYPESPFIYYSYAMYGVFYAFDEEGMCVTTSIIPNTQDDLTFFINKYNKEYRRYTQSIWVMVEDGDNVFVMLRQTPQGEYFFFWYTE